MHFSFFSDKNLNFIGQLYNDNESIKPWKDFKIELHLRDTHKIYWSQIIDDLSKAWKRYYIERQGMQKN